MLATGCLVDLPDAIGLLCDSEHPCGGGLECINGKCEFPGPENDGGTGGGSAGGSGGGGASTGGGTGGSGGSTGGGSGGVGGTGGSGGGGASTGGGTGGSGGGSTGGGSGGTGGTGGGAPFDAGFPIWTQADDGFTGQAIDNGCTLVIEAANGNRVLSTIKSANDLEDRASADQRDAGVLPKTGNGRLVGTFRLPVNPGLKSTSAFFHLGNGTTPHLQLGLNGNGQLYIRSEANTIGPVYRQDNVTWDGGFKLNTDYALDVTWRRGNYRRVKINGVTVVEANNLGAPTVALVRPDNLRLGIGPYDGDADAGWSAIFSDWQLADDPGVVLPR